MKLKISNQQVTIIEPLALVSDTENVYEAEYIFGDEWEGYQKTAVYEGCGASYQVVLTSTNKCKIPNEIFAEPGDVRFGVLGTKVEGSITLRYPTVWSKKIFVDQASIGTGTPTPPTAEVYAQILANEEELADDIEALDGRLDTAESDIDTLESGKVDKVPGKGLSTNDYDNTEKQKVADSYAAKHSHSNKGVLDAITSQLATAWTTASDWVSVNGASILSHLIDSTKHTTSSEKSGWNAKSTVSVSSTGTATDEIEYITVNGTEKKIKSGGDAPVTSVNSKIGDVVLDAEDVGALPDDTPIPTKTSELTNDSGFLTQHQSLANYYTKSETDTEITSHHDSSKADADSVYTKTEADNLLANKVNTTSLDLTTTNKNVILAINEVNSIAKGSNQALSYGNYSTMITAFNSLPSTTYNIGQNIYIVTREVPDLWVSAKESTSVPYTYVDDATFVNELSTNGYVHIGYYKVSMLETQKVDLTAYRTASAQDVIDNGKVGFTDYASESVSGVMKIWNAYGVGINNGVLYAVAKTFAEYSSLSNVALIGKQTLENVLTGKNINDVSNETFTFTLSDGTTVTKTMKVGS